jgi:hypothetical protein
MTKRRLNLEELGARILPSATPMPILVHEPIIPPICPIDPIPIGSLHSALHGQGSGQYSVSSPNPDIGHHVQLTGQVNLGDLGQFNLSGSVSSVGFVMSGRATGTLTLTNAQGTMTLSLIGRRQEGFAALPEKFGYTVTGGTGAYAKQAGQGELILQLQAQSSPSSSTVQGIFKIRF